MIRRVAPILAAFAATISDFKGYGTAGNRIRQFGAACFGATGWSMSTGLYRIEWTGLATLGSYFASRPGKVAINHFKPGLIGLAVALTAGCGGWVLLSGDDGTMAESEPIHLASPAVFETVAAPATAVTPDGLAPDPEIVPAQAAPVDGLKISSQHWRRGGLGSKALVTFTLRNRNDYAVRDIEISCAFSRRDGSHLTDRTRVIHDTVRMKSRRTFARLHVGFVNVNANQAKCSLVSASQI